MLLVATPLGSPTGRDLAAARTARLALGHTRDVSMIEGAVEVLEWTRCRRSGETGSPCAPGSTRVADHPYRWFQISPRRIQAWREVDELPDRELMRNGRWLV